MSVDLRLLEELQRRKDGFADQAARRGTSGGGGEPPGGSDTEERLRAVEATLASIDKNLAIITEQLKHVALREDLQSVRTEVAALSGKIDADLAAASGKFDANVAALSGKVDANLAVVSGKFDAKLATLSGKIDGMASAVDLAELKGRVARIPTVPVLVSILLFISLLFAAASWAIRHLPESWSRLLG